MDHLRQCIRTLDDHLQKNPTSDIAIMTPGIAALGREAFDRVIKTITAFAEVCYANEPDENHHTGSFAAEGRVISFKIDHYERPARSAERAGQADRVRVISVMLAEENTTTCRSAALQPSPSQAKLWITPAPRLGAHDDSRLSLPIKAQSEK